MAWLRNRTSRSPAEIAVAIEIPRGAIVETLMERGFPVFSLNPKQLDRFRDRYSPAGAKDDRRDAFVLADSLRTDLPCFHAVRQDDPTVIRLRELSRLEDDVRQEQNRLTSQLREQWHRFFPQMLKLSRHDAQRSFTSYRRTRLPRLALRRRFGAYHPAERQEGCGSHAPRLQ